MLACGRMQAINVVRHKASDVRQSRATRASRSSIGAPGAHARRPSLSAKMPAKQEFGYMTVEEFDSDMNASSDKACHAASALSAADTPHGHMRTLTRTHAEAAVGRAGLARL